jgi:hypothetical protein
MNYGKWGNLFVESLRETYPEEYQRMSANGELGANAREVQTRADRQFQDLIAQLLKQHPAPVGFVEESQHMLSLGSMANELVADDVIVRPPEEETELTRTTS